MICEPASRAAQHLGLRRRKGPAAARRPNVHNAFRQGWERNGTHDTIARIGHRAGIPLHPHLLCHTASTLGLDAGAPFECVQDLLGHADPRTTMRQSTLANSSTPQPRTTSPAGSQRTRVSPAGCR